MRTLPALLAAASLAAGCGADIDVTVGSGAAAADDAGRAPAHGTVDRVVDGDTFRLGDERVRLIGVDTSESVKPDTPVQCYGRQAAAFLRRVLDDERVTLTYDVERRDRYGRLLAYVTRDRDDLDVGAELLRRGYAMPLAIAPNVARARRYGRLAARARDARRGLWGHCRT